MENKETLMKEVRFFSFDKNRSVFIYELLNYSAIKFSFIGKKMMNVFKADDYKKILQKSSFEKDQFYQFVMLYYYSNESEETDTLRKLKYEEIPMQFSYFKKICLEFLNSSTEYDCMKTHYVYVEKVKNIQTYFRNLISENKKLNIFEVMKEFGTFYIKEYFECEHEFAKHDLENGGELNHGNIICY